MNRDGKVQDKILTAGFCLLLGFFFVLSLILPDQELSENENRSLKQFSVLSGAKIVSCTFMDDFEEYTSDQFPFRDNWVTVKNTVDLAAGKRDNGQVYFGKNGWLFQIEEISEKQLSANLEYIKEFFTSVKEKEPEIILSVLPAPTSSEVAKEQLPAWAVVPDENARIREIESALRGYAAVCDVTELLKEQYTEGESVYYKTDHHWTTLGAYYAYKEWAASVGLEPLEYDDFNVETVSWDFYGTNHSKSNLVWTKPDRIDVFIPKESHAYTMTVETGEGSAIFSTLYDETYLDKKDKYAYFLSGNNPVTTIEADTAETDTANGKTILVIKDSYAHCFIPFLTAHYEKIIVVDLRYYKDGMDRFFTEDQITDVLVLYNVIQLGNDRNLYYLQ